MVRANRFTALALGLVVVALGDAQTRVVSNSRPATAADWLQRSMQRNFPQNVVAVIVQRDPNNEQQTQTVKVERNRVGKLRQTVLFPLRMQGIESIDDGSRSLMYLPDQKVILDQESAQLPATEVANRVRLAQRNYVLRTEAGGTVAGRATICLVATPRMSGMDTRRYYLDSETAYPLRLTTHRPGAEPIVRFEARDVQFPASLDDRLFEMRPIGGVTRMRYARPETFASSSEVEKAMGFRPNLSNSLPLGFQISEMQTNDSPQWRSLVVRMTDGLVKATLYQWKSAEPLRPVDAVQNRTIAEANGVRMLLVSELEETLRMRLLSAFKGGRGPSAGGTLVPAPIYPEPGRELPPRAPLLPLVSRPEELVRTHR